MSRWHLRLAQSSRGGATAVRRLFSSEKFRRKSVRTAAAAMFYEAGIANTNAEMGVLIYLSLLERRLELIADRGVLKKCLLTTGTTNSSNFIRLVRIQTQRVSRKLIERLGEVLATHVPATGENPNELPDMPRFELK